MLQAEFENLTMRDGESISNDLYNVIERFYMKSDDNKSDFCKKFFGGKTNTKRTITKKVVKMVIDENNAALQGTTVFTNKNEMDAMNDKIIEHYASLAYMDNWNHDNVQDLIKYIKTSY